MRTSFILLAILTVMQPAAVLAGDQAVPRPAVSSTGVLVRRGLPAFPGAEGFGSDTPGGRGGRVIHVTSLEDSDRPGTLTQ